MSTDVTDRLAALRPAPTLDNDERDAMLTAILSSDREQTHRAIPLLQLRHVSRRRLLIGAGIASAAAAAAVLIPVLTPPNGPGAATSAAAAAAELHRLSVVIGGGKAVDLGPGDYWYTDETEVQTGSANDLFGGTGPDHTVTLTTRYLSWTDQNGNQWRQDTGTDQNAVTSTTTWYFDGATTATSPAYLASLPTNPDDLLTYLNSHVSGSNSRDEAVFVAVEPILQSGTASPSLRAAAIQVLSRTDHVTLTQNVRDDADRPAERFDFQDPTVRAGTQSIFFDPTTAQVLETRTASPGAALSQLVHRADLVHEVPADVQAAARHK